MKRLLGAALAGAALSVAAAAPASANDAWLWACHGPDGAGLQPAAPAGDTPPLEFGAGVTATGDQCVAGGQGGGGLTGGLPADPGQSSAAVTVYVPANLTLTGVRLSRATQGFAGEGSGLSYDARMAGGVLESATSGSGDLAGDATFPVTSAPNSGDYVRLEAICALARCAGGPVSYSLSAVALHVDDASKPVFALGGPGRAAGTVEFNVSATDVGTGLRSAQALLDGVPVATASFGGSCADLSPASPQVDLSLLADCPKVAPAKLSFDTRKWPNGAAIADGAHTLTIKVFDAAGNETDQTQALEVANHVDLGSSSQTLVIGSGVPAPPSGGTGGVAGSTATSCTKPKLSVVLDQKPLRIRHRVPVLKKGKRYRFRGRLTCVVRGKRVSAPKRTRVDRLAKVGKRTVDKGGTLVRGRGRLTFIVPALSSRTLIFRFTNSNGRRVQVKIKIKVARR